MKSKHNITKEFLEKALFIDFKSVADIANELNLAENSVSYWIKKFGIILKGSGRKRNITDIINKHYDNFQVIKPVKLSDKLYGWECRCHCGAIFVINYNPSHKSNGCKTCCAKNRSIKQWQGYKEITGDYWRSLQTSAKAREIVFDITIEYAWDLYEQQDRRCKFSGLNIIFSTKWNAQKHGIEQTASLDRIDNNKGYIENNVQWIHKKFQSMKMRLSDEEFINNCIEVAEYNKQYIVSLAEERLRQIHKLSGGF